MTITKEQMREWCKPSNTVADSIQLAYEAGRKSAVSEPAAWVNRANLASASVNTGAGDTHTWSETKTVYHDTPLYTAPPAEAKSLTDGEILQIALKSELTQTYWLSPKMENYADEVAEVTQFARAIEAAIAKQPAEAKRDMQQIAKVLRIKCGLTLVKTASGYDVMKLGDAVAHNIGAKEQ
jgi:hypothetical protein